MNPSINLSTGINTPAQIPTDSKRYFKTIEEAIDLGANSFLAYSYYDGMIVVIAENKKEYIWKEFINGSRSLSGDAFVYPDNLIVNGIDYSNKKYAFQEYKKTSNFEITGGIISYLGTNYNYIFSPINYIFNDIEYFINSANFTLDNGGPQNRFDILVLNKNLQTVQVVKGIEAENPVIPYYNKNTQHLLGTIFVKELSTQPDTPNLIVYNEYLEIANGEWDVDVTTGNPVFILDALANTPLVGVLPFDGQKYIIFNPQTLEIDEVEELTFVNDSQIERGIYTGLIFRVQSKGLINSGTNLQIFLTTGANQIVSDIVNVFDDLVFDYETANWQTVIVPFELFNQTGSFDKIVFNLKGFTNELLFDKIELTSGVVNVPQLNTYLNLVDTEDSDYVGKKRYTPVVNENENGLILVPRDKEVRIGNLWFYPQNEIDPQQITTGQEFRGNPTNERYITGVVLDAVGFDIDDITKARLFVDLFNED